MELPKQPGPYRPPADPKEPNMPWRPPPGMRPPYPWEPGNQPWESALIGNQILV